MLTFIKHKSKRKISHYLPVIVALTSILSTSFARQFDYTKPEVVITSAFPKIINTSFTVTFTFSEAVTGFDDNDILLVNGTGSAFSASSCSVYTLVITPVLEGNVEVSVRGGAANDLAANSNKVSNTLTRLYDTTLPTVEVLAKTSGVVNAPFIATFKFSEAVTGFIAEDVVIVNGSGSSFTAKSARVYTMLITPDNNGEVEILLPAGPAWDAAANGNLASNTLKLAIASVQLRTETNR